MLCFIPVPLFFKTCERLRRDHMHNYLINNPIPRQFCVSVPYVVCLEIIPIIKCPLLAHLCVYFLKMFKKTRLLW